MHVMLAGMSIEIEFHILALGKFSFSRTVASARLCGGMQIILEQAVNLS